ncbi:unnamed protein product [Chrysoparadoxa australica]
MVKLGALAAVTTLCSCAHGFTMPHQGAVGLRMTAAASDVSSDVISEVPPAVPKSEPKPGVVQGIIRDAIWQATDHIEASIDPKVDVDANVEHALDDLGDFLKELDNKYFAKSSSPTSQYLDSISAPSSTDKTEKAAEGDAAPAAAVAVNRVKETAKAVEKKDAKESGAVDLQRPKPVKNLMEEFQKSAVAAFKGSSSSTVPKAAEIPVADAKVLESELEALLEKSDMKPSKLGDDSKSKLVAAVEALEQAYAASPRPVKDPALFGEWSLVYSSTDKIFKNALGAKRSMLFRISQPVQFVDTAKMAVTNMARMRLRLTPFAFTMKQAGSYKEVDNKTVELTYRRGALLGFLRIFKKPTVTATVTYALPSLFARSPSRSIRVKPCFPGDMLASAAI